MIHVLSLFFNDRGTPEIYTYGHTLSLLDALPFCLPLSVRLPPTTQLLEAPGMASNVVGNAARSVTCRRSSAALFALPLSRSEEHTSELQSLMRTSYAVFCLKKNNH